MNLGQAFSFPFQDPDWLKKIGLMGLIFLIPILGQIIVVGWCLDITRRVQQRNPVLLPDIDLGKQLNDGFKAFVAGLVYSIPIFIMQTPIIVTSTMAESSSSNAEAIAGAVAIISLCCGGLIFLYSLALALVIPAAYGNIAAKDSLGAAFDFPTIFRLVRAAPGAYLLTLLGTIAAGFVAGLGLIVCVIGVLFTYVYSMAVMGHLYGQAYNQAVGNQSLAGPAAVL